jgi:hypothetical protein
MPMIMPPIYLDVPAVVQVAGHASSAESGIGRAMPHVGAPIARPLGSTQVPDIVAPPRPPAAPQGSTQGPDAAPASHGR